MIRPRITDFYGISALQMEVSFAIPFLDEDLPLYVDPFLLWKSPSQQDNALHVVIVDALNSLGRKWLDGLKEEAVNQLVLASECSEVGLGQSKTRRGKPIGRKEAETILRLFEQVPQIRDHGIKRIEVLQLLVPGIGRDRVSDLACSFIKSFLIDYTTDQCIKMGIPCEQTILDSIYSSKSQQFEQKQAVRLPVSPVTNEAVIFVPKRWLRFIPWINFENYFSQHVPQDDEAQPAEKLSHVEILDFNRHHYDAIERYVEQRVLTAEDCKSDPLFSQIPISSAKSKLNELKKLQTGISDKADKRYEELIVGLLASFFYPDCDFAKSQARTDSGVCIRDLIFYNNRSHPFLRDVFDIYESRQLVFEMKNVAKIEREHINQLNRYMSDSFGKFGVFVTRNPLPSPMFKNTIDLWSAQRKAIIAITDQDIEQMVDVFETKQRSPLDVLKKKYFEFTQKLPK
ncbi:MAG: hypothetical protein V4584_12915 [Verrucomicrobiota bacterium]